MPNALRNIPVKIKLMSDSLAGKSYKTTKQSNQFIVIHNMCGTSESSLNYWNGGSGGQHTSAHYCVDDKEIWQTLKDSWVGHHCGRPSGWAGLKGCNNNTSIGIEIADTLCNQRQAVENAIDLARYLAKTYNIPFNNIVRHKDVSSTDCPAWIESHNLWDYFKQELVKRDQENDPLCFDPSPLKTGENAPGSDNSGSVPTEGTGGTLPNFDNREDWTNLKEVKGVSLVCLPPFHFTTIDDRSKYWSEMEHDREFHFSYDGRWLPEKEPKLIAFSIKNNKRHTYIERAMFESKSPKSTLGIGMFIPPKITDYPKYEKDLIDNVAKVLYDNKLQTKDLWREFDLNREPSPFMYLDREQWKKFLREIDKQVQWRYKNYGNPVEEEKDPEKTGNDYSKLKDNVGKRGYANKDALIRENPSFTSVSKETLKKNDSFEILEANDRGYYKVKKTDTEITGWIIADSVKFTESQETEKPDNNITKPEITPTMTHEQYLKWQKLTDPKLIDEYVGECEPYDKGLKEIIESSITNDDRLSSLSKELETNNTNVIRYSVTEGSPGDSGHCAKPAAELNMLFKPKETTKVDPVYPDLVVPPNYAPTEHNINQQNPIPMTALEDGSLIKDSKDFDNNQLTFDYELLNDKKKTSKGKPINYLDPYPYDDKVIELEKHHPKIKIDEIEARLYESNHPGDPTAQPLAKNFALVYDAMLKQSSNIEKRLVKIENVLATVLRNQGRIGSRINVNCVYFGGQDTFGKYKTIRCLCDDRIHDGCSVTLDQCLNCTRYEPILGQIYDILDDTGMNGSVFLDNMQMSYMELEDLKNLNRVERRNSKNKFANVNKEIEKPKSQVEEWEKADKDAYIASLKEKITDDKELEKKTKEMKEEDYAFKMNWYEQDLESQEPDVKVYPIEGIKKRYKKTNINNKQEDDEDPIVVKDDSSLLDKETDKDVIKDMSDLEKLDKGEWVDTREEADTNELVQYSSENYYFEDYNKSTVSGIGSSPGGVFGAEARQKIVEKAKEIVELHKQGKAGYSWDPRTVDDTDRKIGSNSYLTNVAMYDCSSLVSCCYKYAGLNSMYGTNTNGQIERVLAKKMPEQLWMADDEGLKKALPGDLIYTTKDKVPVSQNTLTQYRDTEHVMIYIGDNKIAHAAKGTVPVPKQIRIDGVDYALNKPCNFFVRPWDLIEADKKAQENGISSGGAEVTGTISTSKGENFNTIYSFPKAVCSGYTDVGSGACGVRCNPNDGNVVAAHNIPYGTIIYIKDLDGTAGGGTVKNGRTGAVVKSLGAPKNGVFYVGDTGGPYFDFDICTYAFSQKKNMDVVVLEWGSHDKPFWSFTDAMNNEGRSFPKYPDAIRSYKRMNGCTINFFKFKDKDKNINSTQWASIK